MATKTKSQSAGCGERVREGILTAGLNWVQLARVVDVPRTKVEQLLQRSEFSARELPLAVRIANVLKVDPRWLALGEPSAAGVQAVSKFRVAYHARGNKKSSLAPNDVEAIEGLLFRLPQPPLRDGEGYHKAGICRYCGCTPYMACESGCSWVDRDGTICSACLTVRSLELPGE